MLILLAIILGILISVVATTYKYGIGPTPTSPPVKAAWLKILPKLSESGSIYELGAGFGTLSFALADHYPDHEIIAIEVSLIPYGWMRLQQEVFPRKNLKIIYGDFFKMKLLEPKLIVCYLYPGAMQKLELKIDEECPQAMIISHTFAFPNRKPSQISFANDLYHTPLYIYE
jgi:hypothetical protein